MKPDEILMRDCGSPGIEKENAMFGDLFVFIKSLQSALAQCNNDKRALREWSQSVE